MSLFGDVNGSGAIDIGDAAYIASYLADMDGYTEPILEVANVSESGTLTIGDAAYIASFLADLDGYDIENKTISTGGDFMMRVDGNNVQTKIPADHTLVGFLASFTGSNISYNTSTLNNVITGNHKVSHAVATDEGVQGTGDWQTVFTLNSAATLDTSSTPNTITGTPETHLAVVANSAPHTILTKHTGNSSDFF